QCSARPGAQRPSAQGRTVLLVQIGEERKQCRPGPGKGHRRSSLCRHSQRAAPLLLRRVVLYLEARAVGQPAGPRGLPGVGYSFAVLHLSLLLLSSPLLGSLLLL